MRDVRVVAWFCPQPAGDARAGQDRGLITIALAEGDDSYRGNLRNQLAEPYRTLLGHLREDWAAKLTVAPTDDVDTFGELVHAWVPKALALNAAHKSMGKDDRYPFVLRSRVLDKLRFVHNIVSSQR